MTVASGDRASALGGRLVSRAPGVATAARLLLRHDVQLVICTLGIYACYLNYGLLQERIYASEYAGEKFVYSGFLVAFQTTANAAVAALVLALGPLLFSSGSSSSANTTAAARAAGKKDADLAETELKQKIWTAMLGDYALVSLCYLCAMLFSFTALNHMSYPMQALGKSCKMIPVMLMGIVIRRKRYSLREFACVFLVTAGVALFSFKPAKGGGSQQTTVTGIALLLASLTMDGLTGPLQERLVARYNPSTHELMFWQNICSVAWLALGLTITGEGANAIHFMLRHGADGVALNMAMFALVSAVGQNFIFYTVRNFSALAVTTITTTRKMFTVLLSIFIFEHHMAPRQWAGMMLVFAAIAWEAVAKVRAKRRGPAKHVKVEGKSQ